MMALVTARLEGRDLGSAVSDLQKRLAAVKLPVGYSIEIGGQVAVAAPGIPRPGDGPRHRRGARAGRPRRRVPRADARVPDPLRGAAVGRRRVPAARHHADTDLNVSSAMGLILLVGLVVKNGIVLMDFAARRHAAGSSWRDALLQAGARRLRPILMTTLCTLAGLTPLALGLGAGAELQRPLALAVIGGLTLSTLAGAVRVAGALLADATRPSHGGTEIAAERSEESRHRGTESTEDFLERGHRGTEGSEKSGSVSLWLIPKGFLCALCASVAAFLRVLGGATLRLSGSDADRAADASAAEAAVAIGVPREVLLVVRLRVVERRRLADLGRDRAQPCAG